MNDAVIRSSFHRKRLRRHHATPDTLVVDELGLKHGKCRADIAVINGHLIGYEIKSDEDSLVRLGKQIEAYNDVFDRIAVVISEKHIAIISAVIPKWWGIIVSKQGNRGGISFETIRASRINRQTDPFSIAQLLWSREAVAILLELGAPQKILRQSRAILYQHLVDSLSPFELRCRVSECLKKRRNWRYPSQLSLDDGLSLPSAK